MKKKVFLLGALLALSSVVYAEDLPKFSDIKAGKTNGFGSDSIDAMTKNLKEMDEIVNNLGYTKALLIGAYEKTKKMTGGVASIAKRNILAELKKLYKNDNFEDTPEYKADKEKALKLPNDSHVALADLSNYLPKVIEQADKAIDQTNKNTKDIQQISQGIADSTQAIDDEVTRSTEADQKHTDDIAANKKLITDEVTRSTEADQKHTDDIAANKKLITDEVTRSTEADQKHTQGIAANKAGIEANASAIKHLDSKLNKTTAMMTAMNNVDFQDVNAGEVAIGAGVGHFVGDQAVAVGVAYGVYDDLKVHAKWSGVAGDPHYNAIGGGVTYKFRTR